MQYRKSIGVITIVTAFIAASAALVHDDSRFPDWSGQWKKPRGIGNQWDQAKPMGRGQQAPLTEEYRSILEASLADQKAGGQGEDARFTCITNGMPRIMTVVRPI